MQSNIDAPLHFTTQSTQPAGLHVAIIMDGNGRWASRQGLPRVAGHRAGVGAVRRTIEHAPELGIATLTLYAFSSDNWSRPSHEVQSIFSLLRAYLRLECSRLLQRGVRLEVIGRRDRLPRGVLKEIERTELATSHGSHLNVRVAVDYSSRATIAQVIAEASSTSRSASPSTEDSVRRTLTRSFLAAGGDVDLLIRTGGEKRLSDFLLWESAYAELYFTDRMWPDFNEGDLDAALEEYRRRERRFGAIPASAATQLSTGGAR